MFLFDLFFSKQQDNQTNDKTPAKESGMEQQVAATGDTLLGLRDGKETVEKTLDLKKEENESGGLLKTLAEHGEQLDMSRDDFGLGRLPTEQQSQITQDMNMLMAARGGADK